MSDLFNIAAEQVVLGAMMMAPSEILPVAEIIDVPDFYRPSHGVIFDHIAALYSAGSPADPVAVLQSLQRARERVDAPYLHTLIASVPVAVNACYYARIVRDLSQRRALEQAGTRMVQRARENPDVAIDVLLADAEASVGNIGKGLADEEFEVLNIQVFTEMALEFGDPVIPGVIHEQERAVIVAGEGVGKTELGLQAGVMTAAGLHVFVATAQPPKRVMIVDLENPTASYQRRLTRLLRVAEGTPDWDPDRCHVLSKPGGINLRDSGIQRRLMARIDRVQPNLIVAGPVYKMTLNKGESGEELATIATQFWDRVRERHGSALWLEAHAPMGKGESRDLRPMNSARWMQWPEFGFSLRLSKDQLDPPGTVMTGQFRLNREDRAWPYKLRRSRPWSWEGVYADPVL